MSQQPNPVGSSALRAGAVLTIMNLAVGGIGYAFQVLVGSMLCVDDCVAFNALMAVVVVTCSPLAAFGLVLTRHVAVMRARGGGLGIQKLYPAVCVRLFLACVSGFVLLGVAAPVLRPFLRLHDAASLWLLGAILTATVFVSRNNSLLQGMQFFARLGGVGVGARVIKTVLCMAFVMAFGWGLPGARGGVLVAMAWACGAGAWPIIAGAAGGGSGDAPPTHFSVRLVAPLIAGSVAIVAMAHRDVVLVNHSFDLELSSLYTAAAILGKAVLYPPSGVATAIYALALENNAKGRDSRGLVKSAVMVPFAMCGLVSAAYCLAGGWIIASLFGIRYDQVSYLLAMYGLAMVPMGGAIVVKHFLLANDCTALAWLFAAAACVEAVVSHVWHPSLEAVIAVLAACNCVLAVVGLCMLAAPFNASHAESAVL